jgi:hypothetical protein
VSKSLLRYGSEEETAVLHNSAVKRLLDVAEGAARKICLGPMRFEGFIYSFIYFGPMRFAHDKLHDETRLDETRLEETRLKNTRLDETRID